MCLHPAVQLVHYDEVTDVKLYPIYKVRQEVATISHTTQLTNAATPLSILFTATISGTMHKHTHTNIIHTSNTDTLSDTPQHNIKIMSRNSLKGNN